MKHAPGCTKENRVQNCFTCHMESEKEKYGDSVQFFKGPTLTLEVGMVGNVKILRDKKKRERTNKKNGRKNK